MKPCSQYGFTLLELLVALAIFSVVAALAYGGLSSVLDSRTETEYHADRLTQLQRTFLTLGRDLGQQVPRGTRDAYGEPQAAFASSTDGEGLFTLTRGGWRNPADTLRSELRYVQYRLRDDVLWRDAWQMLDRAPDSEPVEMPLVDKVRAARIRYLDNEDGWHEQWPPLNQEPGTSAGTPRAVEVELELEDYGRIRRLYALQR